LADRSSNRLGIDQVPGHRGLHLLVDGHLFLDSPLHPDQSEPELILEQLAHRADAAISQVVDVVRFADALTHLEQVSNNVNEIDGRQSLVIEPVAFGNPEFDVELETPDAREIELAIVKEHSSKQVPRGKYGRRIAGPHLPVYFKDRIARRLDAVFL